MATQEDDTTDDADDGAQIFEIDVREITAEQVTIRANSREEAFEALKQPVNDREVSAMLARKDFRRLVERRPIDGRHAPELEDYPLEEVDIDVDLTE